MMSYLHGKIGRRPLLKGVVASMLPGAGPAGAAEFRTFSAPTEARLLPLRIGAAGETVYLKQEIVCTRPVRIGGIRVEVEDIGDKAVVHCYGHGGSGWTLAPGTTAEAVQRLESQLSGPWSARRGSDVVIIGSGIIGQMCAYHLHKMRLREQGVIGSITMVAERSEGITSDHAGGLFEPVQFGRDVFQKKRFLDSYRFYRDISLGRSSDFPAVDAEMLPVFGNAPSQPTTELIQLGEIPPAIRMNVRINSNLHRWTMTQLFYMNVPPFNRLLARTLRNWSIPLQTGVTVRSFSDLSAPIVFNCAGLGAGALCDDANVVPYTGHLVTFRNQPRGLLDIDNTQYVEAGQVPGVVKALKRFNVAFADGQVTDPETDAALRRLREAHSTILARLRRPVEEADPDWQGITRVRLFDMGTDRTAVTFDQSKIMAATASDSTSDRHAAAVAAYSSMVNMRMKRYMFGLVEDYPTGQDCDTCATSYAADSYGFPLLEAPLRRMDSGSYHYMDTGATSSGVDVFVAGGTYIKGSDLTPARDAEEFRLILDRLRFLGFR